MLLAGNSARTLQPVYQPSHPLHPDSYRVRSAKMTTRKQAFTRSGEEGKTSSDETNGQTKTLDRWHNLGSRYLSAWKGLWGLRRCFGVPCVMYGYR